jgi:putative salt-induced outer membrane protein YdiY
MTRSWVLTLFVILFVATVRADVVTMTDGSQLVGKIKSLANGKLVLETSFAGDLEIDFGKVASLETDQAMNVATSSGNQLVGPVTRSGDGLVVNTEHAPVPVNTTDLTTVWKEGEKSPDMLALEAAIAARQEALWSATVEIGGTMREGNTDKTEIRGMFELRRKTEDDLLKFYAWGKYANEDDRRNEAELVGGIDYEHNLTERFTWYTGIELEYDEFENIDLRTTVKAGVGYYWFKEETVDLRTRVGLGYLHESFTDGTNDDRGFTDLGLAVRWDIAEWVRFTHDASYRPGWDDVGDYRLRFDTGVAIPLGSSQAWKFKIGMLNEYDSRPAPGVERLDNTYYSSIVVEID